MIYPLGSLLATLVPSLVLATFFGFFKAVANSMEHHPEVWPFTPFWNTRHPDNDKVKRIFRYPLDGYHLAGSGMWLCVGLTFPSAFEWYWEAPIVIGWGVIVFNIFYNKVFK
jgi:hypothetical protein